MLTKYLPEGYFKMLEVILAESKIQYSLFPWKPARIFLGSAIEFHTNQL